MEFSEVLLIDRIDTQSQLPQLWLEEILYTVLRVSEAIARVLTDDGLRESMGAAARSRVAANFSVDRMTGEWDELLSGAVGRRV